MPSRTWASSSPTGRCIYYDANPGYGYSLPDAQRRAVRSHVSRVPKAKREYWAVNLSLDKRFSDNWMAGFSYTWSRLTGNYSGLASSDEYVAPGEGGTARTSRGTSTSGS